MHHSPLPLRIEAVADREHELVVAQVSAVGGEISLQVVMRPERGLDRAGDEAAAIVGRQRGSKILLAQQDLQAQAVAHLARKRERFIRPLPNELLNWA